MNRNLTRLGSAEKPKWLDNSEMERLDHLAGLPFDDSEYMSRLDNVRAQMEVQDLRAYAIFRPSTVEYLCGHHTVEPLPQPLVVMPEAAYLLVPEAELGRAVASSNTEEILYYSPLEDGMALLGGFLSESLPSDDRVGLELQQTGTPPRLAQLLSQSGFQVQDANYLAETLRLVVSPAELALVKAAAKITEQGVVAAVAAADGGKVTDSQIAAAVKGALVRDANSQAAFDVVVATGWRGGVPHSTWSNVEIEEGTTTFLEFSGAHHRYVAPVMRTLSHGVATGEARRLEDYAQTMLASVRDTLRPGVLCSDVAMAAKKSLGELDSSTIFHFNFGYPVGLAHPPTWMDGAPNYLIETNHAPVEEGMLFHLPASFRTLGRCGVGLSQTVYVGGDGVDVISTDTPQLRVV